MSEPAISVVMACYNASASVEKAITSILSQTFIDFEFIIVDDGSKDDTLSKISSFQDDRIVILQHHQNLGLSAALNNGIAAAKSMLIARMDADDEALPERLQLQWEYMNNHTYVDILGSSVLNRSSISTEPKTSTIMPLTHQDIVNRVFKKSMVLHPTIMVRKHVYDELGMYDPTLRWAEDADLWYRIYDKVTWANIEKPLLIYTTKQRLSWKIVSTNMKVKTKNLRRRGILLRYSGVLLLDMANYSWRLLLRR